MDMMASVMKDAGAWVRSKCSTEEPPWQLTTEQRASNERLALQRARACLSLNVARNLPAWAELAGGNSAAVTTSCEGITVSSGIYHAPLTASSRPQQNSHDTRRHQMGHRAADHGAECQFGQIVPPVGCKRAESANLDADGAEVGKAAQRKGRDGHRPRIERSLLRA